MSAAGAGGAGAGGKLNPFKTAVKANLFAAVKANDAILVERILTSGSDPNVRDALGATPLMYAINEGLENMVKLLLYFNADVNIEGPKGWFPLLFAVEREHHGILADLLLVPELEINKTLPDGITALHIAAQNNDPVAAKLLLARGADVNAVSDAGNTPFMILAQADVSENLSEMKRILQAAMAEAAAPAAAAAGPTLYPKNMKHKKEGGRRRTKRRKAKRNTRRHA